MVSHFVNFMGCMILSALDMHGILDNFRGLIPRKVTRFTHPLKDDIALKTKNRCKILCECECFTLDTPDLVL
jgi:hypothetical protein